MNNREIEFIELLEKSYKKRHQESFITGALLGIALGLCLGAIVILIMN